jgi:hypothetical protein
MDLYASSVHSFIVKLWIETESEEDTETTWRGHITHVPDGRRQYLKELDDAIEFMEPYLLKMGMEHKRRGPVGRWLRRLGWSQKRRRRKIGPSS